MIHMIAELAIGKAHTWSWRDCRAIVTFTWKPMNMVSALVDLCWFDPCTRFSPGRDVRCHLQPDSTLLQGSGHVDVARFLCEAGADKEPSDHPVAVTWSSLMIWFLRTKLQHVTAEKSKMPVILWCYRYLWIRWVLYRENSIGLFRYREDRAMMEGATPLLAAALQGHTKVADWIGWCWQQPANLTNL